MSASCRAGSNGWPMALKPFTPWRASACSKDGPHQLDARHQRIVGGGGRQRAVQVVEHREQVLDQLLHAELLDLVPLPLRPLAVVLQVGHRAHPAVVDLLQLLLRLPAQRLGELELGLQRLDSRRRRGAAGLHLHRGASAGSAAWPVTRSTERSASSTASVGMSALKLPLSWLSAMGSCAGRRAGGSPAVPSGEQGAFPLSHGARSAPTRQELTGPGPQPSERSASARESSRAVRSTSGMTRA